MRYFSIFVCIALATSVCLGQTTPIYDIQYTTDPSGDSPLLGQTVTIEGVVTAALSTGFFMTDATGPWNSIYVYTNAAGCAVEAGDNVTVVGLVDEYFGMTEIKEVSDEVPVSCTINSSGAMVPTPVLSTVDVAQEQYEAMRVTVVNVDVVGTEDYGQWTVDDGTGVLKLDDDMDYLYAPAVGDSLDSVTGVVNYSFSEFKLNPRFSADIVDPDTPHYALYGTVVTMNDSLDVLQNHYVEVFGDQIVSISDMAPSGAQVVSVSGLIFPGLIDPHNHPQYNVLGHIPFETTFVDRDDWHDDPMYSQFNSQFYGIRDYGGADAQEANIWKLAEVRAMAAGTTMIQGSNCYGHSSDSFARRGVGINNVGRFPSHAYSVTFPLTFADWDYRSAQFWNRFPIHLSEGISAAALAELDTWDVTMGLLDDRTAIIHGVPYGPAEWARLAAADAHLIWSPVSNWVLYGATANIPQALAAGVNVALSPDWTPSGGVDLLEEMRFAEHVNQTDWAGVLTPEFFAEAVTRNAALALGIEDRVGQIAEGFDADLAVFPGDPGAPYDSLMGARAKTVQLTVVAGHPRYGDPELMDQFTFLENVEDVSLCGHTKRLALAVTHHAIPESETPFADIMSSLRTAYDASTPQLCDFLGLDPCELNGIFADGFEGGDTTMWDEASP